MKICNKKIKTKIKEKDKLNSLPLSSKRLSKYEHTQNSNKINRE